MTDKDVVHDFSECPEEVIIRIAESLAGDEEWARLERATAQVERKYSTHRSLRWFQYTLKPWLRRIRN